MVVPKFFPRSQLGDVPRLKALSGPRGLAQESEAGLDAGIELEAAHGNAVGHLSPTMPVKKSANDGFKLHTVKRITGMRATIGRHGRGVGDER